MDSESEIQIPPLIRRAAQHTVRGNETIEAVLLFGSRARGDHTGESDYDIAIVTGPRFERPPETAMALCDPDLEKKFGTQLVFVRREGLERDANTAGTLASRIAREGAIIAGDWRRPQCREGNELDIDTAKALAWAEAMSLKGAWAGGWLEISSLEEWDGDNAAAMAVHLMAEHVAKGIVATFGVYETDIHDLDATADELANAYRDTGWKQPERSEFAKRIRSLEGKGRAATRAAKREDEAAFEPLNETIARLGKVWDLLMTWLEMFRELHPEAEDEVAHATRKLETSLPPEMKRVRHGSANELDEHIRRTRAEAQRLIAKLEGDAPRHAARGWNEAKS